MRVLLQNSGCLSCMEVLTASVQPEDNELVLENPESCVTVSGIGQINAERAVRTLYSEGMVDLTMYQSDI